MAWTDPAGHVWTTGEIVTAASMNTYIKDDLLALANPDRARAFHNANQSITHNTNTALALNSERFDTNALHDLVTNNSRLTCKTAGAYIIGGHVRWATSVTAGTRVTQIRFNGTTLIGRVAQNPGTVNDVVEHGVATLYPMAVNDYVELVVFQFTGAALVLEASAQYTPEFWMTQDSFG